MKKKRNVKKVVHKKLKSIGRRARLKVTKKPELIKEALSDINKEITHIQKDKKNLNARIQSLDQTLTDSIDSEKKLQERIARLIKAEATLKERKKIIGQKEEKLGDRLGKIKRIKLELSDI